MYDLVVIASLLDEGRAKYMIILPAINNLLFSKISLSSLICSTNIHITLSNMFYPKSSIKFSETL